MVVTGTGLESPRGFHLPGQYLFFFFFLELHLWHMEVSRLGVKPELQLQAYTAAIASLDPSHICDLR